jgi:hypothetical protein
MADDYNTLFNLTATSGTADISATPLSGRNLGADKMVLLVDLWRPPPERLERIADFAEFWLATEQTHSDGGTVDLMLTRSPRLSCPP